MIYHQSANSRENYNYHAHIYSGIAFEPHFHKNFELLNVLRGSISVTVNGYKQELSEGEMLLIAPNAVHAFRIDENTEVWVGVFSGDIIPIYAKINTGKSYSSFRCDKAAQKFLSATLFREGETDLYTLTACLSLVCAQCVKYAPLIITKADANVINAVIEYISENYTYDITLRGTSEALGYEYHYFSKLFHDCFNMNFRDFIGIYRVEAACGLIRDEDKDLTSVAMESGFQSVRNFNRTFKKLCGITPSEYRKSIKKPLIVRNMSDVSGLKRIYGSRR